MDTSIAVAADPSLSRTDLAHWSPARVRAAIREGRWRGTTHGASRGFLQANLAVVPERYAFDFLCFCLRNPQPCPVIEVLDPGCAEPRRSAPGADVRTDLSRYRIYRDGRLDEEVSDLSACWRDDHVVFLLGCSLSFDDVLDRHGIPMAHLADPDARVPTYRADGLPCEPAGAFAGPMVVTMRPIPDRQLARAVEITGRYPLAHGAPVHIGNPAAIGITDLSRAQHVEGVTVPAGSTPVFWGCGVTPQAVAMAARLPEMFTHAAGHMFLCDLDLAGQPVR